MTGHMTTLGHQAMVKVPYPQEQCDRVETPPAWFEVYASAIPHDSACAEVSGCDPIFAESSGPNSSSAEAPGHNSPSVEVTGHNPFGAEAVGDFTISRSNTACQGWVTS